MGKPITLGDFLSVYRNGTEFSILTGRKANGAWEESLYEGTKKAYEELPHVLKSIYDNLIVKTVTVNKDNADVDIWVYIDIDNVTLPASQEAEAIITTETVWPEKPQRPKEPEVPEQTSINLNATATNTDATARDISDSIIVKNVSDLIIAGISDNKIEICISMAIYRDLMKYDFFTDGYIEAGIMVIKSDTFNEQVLNQASAGYHETIEALRRVGVIIPPENYRSFPAEGNNGDSFYALNMARLQFDISVVDAKIIHSTFMTRDDPPVLHRPTITETPASDEAEPTNADRAINDGVMRLLQDLVKSGEVSLATDADSFKHLIRSNSVCGYFVTDNILAISEEFFTARISDVLSMDIKCVLSALRLLGNNIDPNSIEVPMPENCNVVCLNIEGLHLDLSKVEMKKYGSSLANPTSGSSSITPPSYANDKWFFEEFIRWVLSENISIMKTGMMQNRFGISFARASRLLKLMDKAGLTTAGTEYHTRKVRFDKCRQWMTGDCKHNCAHCIYYSLCDDDREWCGKNKYHVHGDKFCELIIPGFINQKTGDEDC